MRIAISDVRKIFEDALNVKACEIKECGHIDLRRNKVYRICSKSDCYVIKFYYKAHKQVRELNTLNYYKSHDFSVLKHGSFESYEWSIYPYIKGEVMEDVYLDLSSEEKKSLFYELGREMARFHNCAKFDFFGDWIDGKYSSISAYKDFIISDTERIIANIERSTLKPYELLNDAIIEIRSLYDTIETMEYATLCHRDLDGRNILISREGDIQILTFLDFEKSVRFNPTYDIINLYRKYFYKDLSLVEPFYNGYCEIKPLPKDFIKAFRFNLVRMGLDLASWSLDVSESFYLETIAYLKIVMEDHKIFEENRIESRCFI